ncbi:MAG: 50S ribosomal protein L9 [Candidatus Vogelbacteria bacterium]|nr:50S ribosomal protein L9 [Candidatus Vogelbacteria bacterium]
MKIILLQDVAKVGRKHEIKDVNDGFARNFLINTGKAVVATPANIAKINALKKNTIISAEHGEKNFELLAEKLKDLPIVIKAKANPAGHLFAGLHEGDIAEKIFKETGIAVDSAWVKIAKPVKELGEQKIKLQKGAKSIEVVILVESL